jgi:hypothetical protein
LAFKLPLLTTKSLLLGIRSLSLRISLCPTYRAPKGASPSSDRHASSGVTGLITYNRADSSTERGARGGSGRGIIHREFSVAAAEEVNEGEAKKGERFFRVHEERECQKGRSLAREKRQNLAVAIFCARKKMTCLCVLCGQKIYAWKGRHTGRARLWRWRFAQLVQVFATRFRAPLCL